MLITVYKALYSYLASLTIIITAASYLFVKLSAIVCQIQDYKVTSYLVIFCFSSVPACVFAAASISSLFIDLAIICVNYKFSYIAIIEYINYMHIAIDIVL